MTDTSTKSSPRRAYRQTARAEAAEATAERILDVFARRLRESWFDEIRLEDVAREAGVSVQTIVRRFGSKEGLLEANLVRMGDQIVERRRRPAGDRQGALDALVEDYEVTGDVVIRTLAQEARYPAMKRMTDLGRMSHRRWLSEFFAAELQALPAAERQSALDRLVIATDVYVWKLVRRDMGRPVSELRAAMTRLVEAALAPSTGESR